jgi:hypothetical protein
MTKILAGDSLIHKKQKPQNQSRVAAPPRGCDISHVSSSRLRFLASIGALENLQTCDISDCNELCDKIFCFTF